MCHFGFLPFLSVEEEDLPPPSVHMFSTMTWQAVFLRFQDKSLPWLRLFSLNQAPPIVLLDDLKQLE